VIKKRKEEEKLSETMSFKIYSVKLSIVCDNKIIFDIIHTKLPGI